MHTCTYIYIYTHAIIQYDSEVGNDAVWKPSSRSNLSIQLVRDLIYRFEFILLLLLLMFDKQLPVEQFGAAESQSADIR